MLTCILAVDLSGGIAKNEIIPWRIPEDMAFFRQMTIESAVIMGRKTFESLNCPLPNRLNIVVTNQLGLANSYNLIFMNLEQVTAYIKLNADKQLWFIGGAQLLTCFEKKCLISSYILTVIHHNFSCDTKIDIDLIRFETTRLVSDSVDKVYNDLVYHFEYRSIDSSWDHDVLDKFKKFTSGT